MSARREDSEDETRDAEMGKNNDMNINRPNANATRTDENQEVAGDQ